MTVGEVQVQVRRTAPFMATEHARGSAIADLVTDVLARSRRGGAGPHAGPPGRYRLDPRVRRRGGAVPCRDRERPRRAGRRRARPVPRATPSGP